MSTRIPFAQVFKASAQPGDLLDPVDFTPRDVSSPPRNRQPRLDTSPKMSLSSQQIKAITVKGTRTPQMLEYERQAEDRRREQEAIATERSAMLEEESKMQKEMERIEREEYEMRQYYEAESLKHEQELKAHKHDVERHMEKVRAHERRVADHEASSEAFARVIAMPVQKSGGRQVSFYRGINGDRGQSRNGSLDDSFSSGT